jgi:hypothetical protein
MGYSNPGLAGVPQPRRGGLQSPNRTVTLVGTTCLCKAWSFTEDNTPGHHIREDNQVFPLQLTKYEETHNINKSLELRIARVIYRVRQITYGAITKNKQDQAIVTMHTSKLKMNTRK